MKFAYDFAEISGKVPMMEFLDILFIKERAKIFAYIEKLVELKNIGIQPKENLSKHLDDGIFELRVSFENRISRSLYFYESDKQIILHTALLKRDGKLLKMRLGRLKLLENYGKVKNEYCRKIL